MNCNGTCPNIFVAVYLMIVLLQFTTAHQATANTRNGKQIEEGLNGDLYDLFKKRLNSFTNELSIGVNNFVEKKQTEVKSPPQGQKQPFTVKDGLYEQFKNRLDKYIKEKSLDSEHPAVDDELYEEFRKRLDKFGNELSTDARKAFEVATPKELKKKEKRKRAAIDEECVYDLYKNKWDKISNELEHNSDNVIERCGRDFHDILNVLGLNKPQIKSSQSDKKLNEELQKLTTPNTMIGPPNKSELKKLSIPNMKEPIRIQVKKLSLKEIIEAAKKLNNADIKVELISQDERSNLKNSLKKFLFDDYKRQMEKITNAFSKSKGWNTMGRRTGRDMVRVAPDENVLMPADFTKIQLSRHSPKGSVLNNVVSSNLHRFVDLNYDPNESQIDKHYSKNINCRHTVTTNDNLHKKVNRQVKTDPILPLYTNGDSTAAYPTVLVKAIEASLNPQTAATTRESLLASVAKQLNKSPLELAQQLTSTKDIDMAAVKKDPNLVKFLENYFKDNSATVKAVSTQTTDRKPKHSNPSKAQTASIVGLPAIAIAAECDTPQDDNSEDCDDSSSENITRVLDKVLNKLEHMQSKSCKFTDIPDKLIRPEGTPCDIVGSWTSNVLGLRFQIALGRGSRAMAPAEEKNKCLSIEAKECIPPKRHDIMDTDWIFMGSALRQFGGPFYIYSQKSEDNVLATFGGFCRTCGGTDTIFGSWTFMFPSKDCQDIGTSIVNRRDIFRRDNLDLKRTERYKDYLYQKTHRAKSTGGTCPQCCMENEFH